MTIVVRFFRIDINMSAASSSVKLLLGEEEEVKLEVNGKSVDSAKPLLLFYQSLQRSDNVLYLYSSLKTGSHLQTMIREQR